MTEPSDVTPDQPDRTRAWLPTGLLGVLLLALLAAIVWLGFDRRPFDDEDGAGSYDEARAVARQEAVNFFGLDYREPAESLERVLDLATGEFAEQYASKRDELEQNLANDKVVMQPTIAEDGTAVEYVGDDEVWVLVSIDVETSVGGSPPDPTLNRARLKLTLDDGEWRVFDVEEVG